MDYSFDPSVNEIACTLTGEKLRTFWPEWHVLRRIGTGAFSDVYQIYRDYYGMHTSSALKVIRMDTGVWSIPPSSAGPAPAAGSTGSDGSAGPGQEGRPLPFAEEVRIMRLLRGAPNIVSIDDFHIHTDESGTYIFIRMELLTSLLEMINSPHRAPMTLSQIRKLGLDVCRALIYCEQNDIIHIGIWIDGFAATAFFPDFFTVAKFSQEIINKESTVLFFENKVSPVLSGDFHPILCIDIPQRNRDSNTVSDIARKFVLFSDQSPESFEFFPKYRRNCTSG